MKIKLTMKDPDGVYECIREAVVDSLRGLGLSEDERQEVMGDMIEEQNLILREWIKYGEYVTVEFDTKAKTATVLKAEL